MGLIDAAPAVRIQSPLLPTYQTDSNSLIPADIPT